MPTWVITRETDFLLIKKNNVSVATLPKTEIVLQVVLAGEYGNESGIDEVWILYEGKYSWEIPYSDCTVTAATPVSAEDLRTKLLAELNA